jgi:hypothetical protein
MPPNGMCASPPTVGELTWMIPASSLSTKRNIDATSLV